jgi:hypothetical protein
MVLCFSFMPAKDTAQNNVSFYKSSFLFKLTKLISVQSMYFDKIICFEAISIT